MEPKKHRAEVCEDLHQQTWHSPSFMSRIISNNESWVSLLTLSSAVPSEGGNVVQTTWTVVLWWQLCAASWLILIYMFFGSTNTIIAPNPPYSLDLAPCYFSLFPKMKLSWRDAILTQWRKSGVSCSWCLTCLQNRTSREHSKRSKSARRNISLHKVTTSKGVAQSLSLLDSGPLRMSHVHNGWIT